MFAQICPEFVLLNSQYVSLVPWVLRRCILTLIHFTTAPTYSILSCSIGIIYPSHFTSHVILLLLVKTSLGLLKAKTLLLLARVVHPNQDSIYKIGLI